VFGSRVNKPLTGSPGATTGNVVASAGTLPRTTLSASAVPKVRVMARGTHKRNGAFVACQRRRSVSVFMLCPPCLRNAAAATSVAYRVHLSITFFWTTVIKSTSY
jgi:hypothetical protein